MVKKGLNGQKWLKMAVQAKSLLIRQSDFQIYACFVLSRTRANPRQDKTKTRQDKKKLEDNTREDKTRKKQPRQDKTRQEKTRR